MFVFIYGMVCVGACVYSGHSSVLRALGDTRTHLKRSERDAGSSGAVGQLVWVLVLETRERSSGRVTSTQ